MALRNLTSLDITLNDHVMKEVK